MKTQVEKIAKYSRAKRQTKMNNMLVSKGILNEINKEGTFT